MAVQVFQTFEIFYDINGKPLDDGFIWVGQPNLDPEANQISVFFDELLTIPAAQPIRTRNGYPSNAGAQARLFVSATTYSVKIENKNGTQISQSTYTDPLSLDDGASMVGWTRIPKASRYGAEANVRQALSWQPVVLWERQFASLAIGFGVGTPDTWDWTPAIQAFLDYLDSNDKIGFIPSGYYNATQLEVPNGVKVYGAGLGNYGKGPVGDDATVLRQLSGVDDDFIIFKTVQTGGFERVGPLDFGNMILLGNSGNTIGCGISFRKAGDRNDVANHAIIQATTRVHDLLIREFPDDGIFMWRGGVPSGVCDVNCLFNGGYGVKYLGLNTGRTAMFTNLDGDGNAGGALLYLESAASNSCFNIYNIRGEYRTNAIYGSTPTFSGAQPWCVEIGDCQTQSVVNIFGGSLQSSVDIVAPPGREQADAFIKLSHADNAELPLINAFGVLTVNQGGVAGASLSLRDTLNSITVPGNIKTFVYTRNVQPVATAGTGIAVFGENGNLANVGVGTEGIQAKGPVPVMALHETDAGADAKTWTEVASGGQLTRRTVSDAGATNIWERVSRSGASATRIEWIPPVTPGVFTIATLPTASTVPSALAMVTNPAAGKGRLVYSDGVIWRYVSDDSAV